MVSSVSEDSDELEVSSLETESVELLDTHDAELIDSAVLGLLSGEDDADSTAFVDLVCSSYLLKAKSLSSGLLLAMAGLVLFFPCPICSANGFLIHLARILSLKNLHHTKTVPDKVRPGVVQIDIMAARR